MLISKLTLRFHTSKSLFSVNSRRLTAVASEVQLWPGLSEWRDSQIDNRRCWVEEAPVEGTVSEMQTDALPDSLVACGELVLNTADPLLKASITHNAYTAFK